MEPGRAQVGLDDDAGQGRCGQGQGADQQVVEPPGRSAQDHDPLGVQGQGALEGQLEVGGVLGRGVALDDGAGGLDGGEVGRVDRVHVPDGHVDAQAALAGVLHPRVGGHDGHGVDAGSRVGPWHAPGHHHDGAQRVRVLGHGLLDGRRGGAHSTRPRGGRDSLRRHYPDQVDGRGLQPPSQPGAPSSRGFEAQGSAVAGPGLATPGALATTGRRRRQPRVAPPLLSVVMRRTLFTDEHDLFRASFRRFVDQEIVPHHEKWEQAGIVPRELFTAAGEHGFLCMQAPERFGGGGTDDFRYNLIVAEEIQRAGVAGSGLGLTLHTDICLPYFLHLATPDQQERWLPGICSGELITAVAMTEPTIGSDLAGMRTTALRDGDRYVVNGSKTFITNGINADLVITAVKTDPSQRHAGMSLVVLERGMEGFERGRNLDKVGLHAQDTAELFFADVPVPVDNLLGAEGQGFAHLVDNLPQERLSIAMAGVAAARAAFDWTLDYARERTAFGQPIGSFQHSRFTLAEMRTEIDVAQAFVDRCVEALVDGELTAEEAAEAKWWCTELQARVVDRCVQLHGGYGYMLEYPIARAYVDARITTIYGGTTEIMKEIVGRSLGV